MQNHVVMEDSIEPKVTKIQHPNVGEILFYASQKLFITYNTHILIIDTICFSIRSFWEFIVISWPKRIK